jgi:D-3-phosphoglycerate dehydrogenase / 2-oxoglutarate reductase
MAFLCLPVQKALFSTGNKFYYMTVLSDPEALKIIVIDSTHFLLPERLTEAGLFVDYKPDISKEELEQIIHNYDGIILRSKIKLNKEFLEKASKLKFIGRVGSGLENIDARFAESKNIICFNAPEGNRDAVGEHTLGILLAMFNKISIADFEVKSGKWLREANRGHELKGKTVGIIGYGNMGSAFAARLKGMDVKVLAFDKYKFEYSDEYVEETTLEEVFEKTDVLSLHIPLTEDTQYMVNDKFLSAFSRNIFVINTSRGAVVNTRDLVKNMKKGKVLGAALDVLEYESSSFEELHHEGLPEAYHYLIKHPGVVLTPHIAGWTFESEVKLAEILAQKIISVFGKII